MLSLLLFVTCLFVTINASVASTKTDARRSAGPKPTIPPRLSPRQLAKRGYVAACPSGQTTSCPMIGVDHVTSIDGGHYVPMCGEAAQCGWIGYMEPSSDLGSSTTYRLVTDTPDAPYIVPLPIPIGGAPPPAPGPDEPAEPPELPDDFTSALPTISNTLRSCITSAGYTSTVSQPVSFNADGFSKMADDFGSGVSWPFLWYYDIMTDACFPKSASNDFYGHAVSAPATWCQCNTNIYSTQTSGDPCLYSATPTANITITSVPATQTSPVTSCRIDTTTFPPSSSLALFGVTLSGVQSWCTCNDNSRHMLSTGVASPTCSTPAPPAPTAPYAPGVCRLGIDREQNGYPGLPDSVQPSDTSPYLMQGSIYDNNGAVIGEMDWTACGATYPCRLNSKLEDQIVMQPIMPSGGTDPNNLYVQVQVGNTRFSTNDPTTWGTVNVKNPSGTGCRVGPDSIEYDKAKSWSCYFNCTYSGGKSSSG